MADRIARRDESEELLSGLIIALLALAGLALALVPIAGRVLAYGATRLARATGRSRSLCALIGGLTLAPTAAALALAARPWPEVVALALPAALLAGGLTGIAAALGSAPLVPVGIAGRLGIRDRRSRGRDAHAGSRAPRHRVMGAIAGRRLERVRRDPALWVPGIDAHGRAVSIEVEAALGHHALILGATGSGKTTLISGLIDAWLADPDRGSVIAIDCKGDLSTFAAPLRRTAAARRRECASWHLGSETVLDPFSDGTLDARVGRIVEAYEWSEEHYRAMATAYLHEAVDALDEAGLGADLHSLATLVADPEAVAADHRRAAELEALAIRWMKEGGEGRRVRAGLAARLRAWARSDAAALTRAGGERLSDLIARHAVVSITVPAGIDPAQTARWSQLFARASLQAVIATGRGAPVLLVIDEAQFAGGGVLATVLQQGRGLGLFGVLAFQEAEIAYQTLGPAWANPLTVAVGRQGDSESAERAAGLFGTRRVRVLQHQIDTAREVGRSPYTGTAAETFEDVYRAHPQAIRELGVGRFFLTTPGRGGARGEVRLISTSAPSHAGAGAGRDGIDLTRPSLRDRRGE